MASDLVPQEAPEIHDFWSLCIFTMWLFNFLNRELQVKETSGKRDQGIFYQHTLLHHQAVLHYTLPPSSPPRPPPPSPLEGGLESLQSLPPLL